MHTHINIYINTCIYNVYITSYLTENKCLNKCDVKQASLVQKSQIPQYTPKISIKLQDIMVAGH